MRRRGRIRTILGLLLAILIGLPVDAVSARPASAGQPGGVHQGRSHGKSCKSAQLSAASESPTAIIEEDGEADDDVDSKSLPTAFLADFHQLPDLRVPDEQGPRFDPSRHDGRACLRLTSRLRF